MNFGELRDRFKMTLNRRDITPSQVDAYINGSIQRTQRLLRVPADEAAAVYTVSADPRLPIPGDLLKLISITFNGCTELTRVDLTTALRASKFQGETRWFARDGGSWILAPAPAEGSEIAIAYHANFSNLANDTDSNWLTDIASDVIVSGALSAACRVYVDPRRDSFEADFVQAITDLNVQATDDELTNAAIGPAYSFDFCE